MRTALITGGSRGLGLATARQLGSLGYTLELISSSQTNLEAAAADLRVRGLTVGDTHVVDFADLESVKAFAREYREREVEWDLLINNAGIKIQDDAPASAQGYERHMAINHLAHFALTNALLPLGRPGARVVHVSSIVARFADADIFTAKDTSERYASSKLANLLFGFELQRRLAASGSTITSVSAHPGFTKADPYGSRFTRFAETMMGQSTMRGALPIIAAATQDYDAQYIGPRWLELWGAPRAARVPALANDEVLRSEVWAASERMTGVIFPL